MKNTLNISERLSLPSFSDLTPNSFNAKICIDAKSNNEQQQFSPLFPTSTLPITSLSDEYTSSPVLMKPKRNLRNSCTTRKRALTSLTTTSATNNGVDNDGKDCLVHKNSNNNNNKVGRTRKTLSSIPKENNLSLPTDKTIKQNSRKSKFEVKNNSPEMPIRRSTRLIVQSDKSCNKPPLAVASTLQHHIPPIVSISEDKCSSRRTRSSALINLKPENTAKNQRKRRMTTCTNEPREEILKISNTDFNNTSSTSAGSSRTNTVSFACNIKYATCSHLSSYFH